MKHEEHTNRPVELDEQTLDTVTGAGAGKGDKSDLSIGVGELQECTISKSMDTASGKLAAKVRTTTR